MEKPIISIIIPTYNRRESLLNSINSLLNQTRKPDEILVIDDCSPFDVLEYLTTNLSTMKGIEVVRLKSNGGAQKARNTGILKAKGDYVGFLDSDDEYFSNKIEKQLLAFAKNESIDVVSCFSVVQNQTTNEEIVCKWMPSNDLLQKLLNEEFYIDYNMGLYKKSSLKAILPLDEQCPSYQEWDMSIRIVNKGFRILVVEEPLCLYRSFANDSGFASAERQIKGRYYLLKKHMSLYKNNGYRKEFDTQLENCIQLLKQIPNRIDRVKWKMKIKKLSWLY